MLKSVTAVLTITVNCASLLFVRFTAGFSGLDGKTVTLMALWLLAWLSFYLIELTIIEYGALTMTAKKRKTAAPAKTERAFFINIPMTEQVKKDISKQYDSRSSNVDTLEKCVEYLLGHGKLTMKDDSNNNTYICAVIFANKEKPAIDNRCVTVRHRNLEKALFILIYFIAHDFVERYADAEGAEGDLDW